MTNVLSVPEASYTHRRQTKYMLSLRVRFVLLVMLLVGMMFSRVVNLNVVSIVACITYIVIAFWANPQFIFHYINHFVGAFLVWSSLAIIESADLYLFELRQQAHYTGVMPLCGAYYMVFLMTLEWYDKYYKAREKKLLRPVRYRLGQCDITSALIHVGSICVLALLIVMFARVATRPSFRYSYDRFDYRAKFVPGIWGKLQGVAGYCIPILIMNWKCGRKKETLFAFALYALYLFWTGERFTGYLGFIFYISIFLEDFMNEAKKGKKCKAVPKSKKAERKKLWKQIFIFALLAILIVAVIFTQYTRLYSVNGWLHIMTRVSQQGQLWWAIYDRFHGTAPHIAEIGDELEAFTDPDSPTPNYGIYKIMYLCAPVNVVTAKIARGQNYTESTAATIYYYFGPIVLLLAALLFGWSQAWLLRKYYNSVQENRVISSVLLARLLSLAREAESMSRFYKLLNPLSLLVIFLLITIHLLTRRADRKLENQK